MKIKVKLFLGIGVLFAMIIVLILLSSFFINRLTNDTRNILVANYNTLDYARKMEIALNDNIMLPENTKLFLDNLKEQELNVTEVGEQELTDSLSTHFTQLMRSNADSASVKLVRDDISNLMLLNMQAIQRKGTIAEQTSRNSVFWVAIIGTLCFLIGFIMFVNLPGNIANPIKELTESIKQVAARDYSRRVHFQERNEFGELAASFNVMAEKIAEFQAGSMQSLMIEKKRVEALIDNMSDPVIGLDENNRIIFVNTIAVQIVGVKREEMLGKPLEQVAVKNDLVRSLAKDLLDGANGNVVTKAPVKIYANNKESYFEKEIIPIKITPTGEKAERMIGNVILLQNITSHKELDFAKNHFIATVSHELKTPISSIKMSLQLLENHKIGTLNEEQQSLVHSINEDAARLLKITGELLNMTQVEAGSIQISVMPATPAKIVEYAVSSNKTAADSKNISLQVNMPNNLPSVLADKEKTAWVLTNLVSNAIRYSYDNSTVTIGLEQEGDYITFHVADTGQGIPPQYINRIFDRYFRIPGVKKDGTGLGLSIGKEFIEAQGGSISVKSDYGAGSTFSFSLPAYVERTALVKS